MTNLLMVGLRGLRGADGGTTAPAAKRAAGLQTRFALLVVLTCACVLALGAGSAQALQVFSFSFGSTGAAGGDFNSPQGVAVDQSTGDVYVVDAGNFRVEKFTPNLSTDTGNFDLAFGEGVDATTSGNICTASSGDTCQAGTSGTSAGAFESPLFVAVDNSGGSSQGDVYVGDPGDNTVTKFDSSGNLVTSFGTGGQLSGTATSTFPSIDGITVDNSGNLLVIDGNSTVWPFSASGSPGTSFPTDRGTGPAGLDVNSAGNIFKVNGDGSVEELTSTGSVIGTINEAAQATEIAIDRNSGDLYQDVGTSIDHYHFDASGNVVDAGGPCTVVESGSCAPTDSFGTGHLTAGTGVGYDSSESALYAADSADDDVAVFGPPAPGAPQIDGTTTSNLGNQSTTLDAQVNPFDVTTTCQFQYISDADFTADGNTFGAGTQTASCTPSPLTPTGFADDSASANITGLTIATTYDFRVIATNADAPSGGVIGPTEQFTTLGAATIDSLTATNITGNSAQLNTEINPLGNDTTCVFKIVDDSDFLNNGGFNAPQTQTLTCSPSDLGSVTSDVGATAQATGLTAGTLYDYEVVATVPGIGTASSAAQFQTTPPLSVDLETATNITDTGATLNTQINPLGNDTTVQFQYETDAVYQASPPGTRFENATTVPANAIDIGDGTSDASAHVDLTGLTPGVEYHWRAVGTNSAGTLAGNAHSFTTLVSISGVGLPDNRAYEMVSPVNKGGEPFTNEILAGDQAAPNGNAVGYVALSPFPGGAGPSVDDLATRTSTGWVSTPILPEQAPGTTLELPKFGVYSSDLSKGILDNGGGTVGEDSGQDDPALVPGTCTTALFPTPPPAPTTPCTGEATGFANLFVRDNTNASYQLVNSYASAPSGTTPTDATDDGASADLSHVVFDENAPLTSLAPTGQDDLYVWDSSTGADTLLGGGATLGGAGRVLNAVSANGSQIFFTDSDGNLNVFQNGSATQIDKPASGGAGPGGGGQFMTALSDGSLVFFTDGDGAGLTGDTVSGSGSNLYAYNTGTGTLTDLTGSTATPNACQTPASGCVGVGGVLGAGGSAGNYYVYFAAQGVLTNGSNSQGQSPQSLAQNQSSGDENLYVENDNKGTITTTFIATLNGGDGSDWNGQFTARVTPDGTHAAFDSVNSLTGYDNTDANTGGADTEIFLYDATSNALACASCNPNGNPSGSSQLDPVDSQLLLGGNQYLQHELSDDGSRVFFDSNDNLSPHDTNGEQDVYEYENGHDYLISSGTSDSNSIILDASASGNDVFFITRDQLVPQDTDGEYDVYDARVKGGFPAPSPNPPCTGDGCKPGTTPPPAVPTIGTVTFFGPGNQKSTSNSSSTSKKKKKHKKKKHTRITLTSKVVKGDMFAITVRVPANGRITVSGSGVETTHRAVRGGGRSYKLTIRLTATARGAIKGKRKLKIAVRIAYRPATGPSSSVTVPVTVKA